MSSLEVLGRQHEAAWLVSLWYCWCREPRFIFGSNPIRSFSQPLLYRTDAIAHAAGRQFDERRPPALTTTNFEPTRRDAQPSCNSWRGEQFVIAAAIGLVD